MLHNVLAIHDVSSAGRKTSKSFVLQCEAHKWFRTDVVNSVLGDVSGELQITFA